jgi:hypothetical protein
MNCRNEPQVKEKALIWKDVESKLDFLWRPWRDISKSGAVRSKENQQWSQCLHFSWDVSLTELSNWSQKLLGLEELKFL